MASKRKKKSAKEKSAAKGRRIFSVRLGLWIMAFGITFAGLLAILLLPHKEEQVTVQSPQPSQIARQQEAPEFQKPVTIDKTRPFVYEERIGANFDLLVWQADMAIIQTLALMGHGEERMVHKTIEPRFFYGTPYHYQEITIYTSNDREEFVNRLKTNLDRLLSNATLDRGTHDNQWSLFLNGQNTHVITLEKILERPLPGTGRLVLIIDDLGGSLHYARKLSQLDFPVIFSILPLMPETTEVVNFARSNNIETMLHLPMEPMGYPGSAEPGPGALFVDMDDIQIRSRVVQNLAQVPDAIGVNNHMGSRFTQDYRGMAIVFEELKKRDLFFLDSLTTPKSVAEKMAREKDLDFIKRHVFLDNVQDQNAIIFQLSKAENIAIKHGLAVAIGHPYPETLEALKKWSRLRNTNVEVVRVSELMATKRYRTAFQDSPEAH